MSRWSLRSHSIISWPASFNFLIAISIPRATGGSGLIILFVRITAKQSWDGNSTGRQGRGMTFGSASHGLESTIILQYNFKSRGEWPMGPIVRCGLGRYHWLSWLILVRRERFLPHKSGSDRMWDVTRRDLWMRREFWLNHRYRFLRRWLSHGVPARLLLHQMIRQAITGDYMDLSKLAITAGTDTARPKRLLSVSAIIIAVGMLVLQ